MTFAVSSTNLSGAIGGVNQTVKPNLDTDSGFDKILDMRVEKNINQNKQKQALKFKKKPIYDVDSKDVNFKKSSSDIIANEDSISRNSEKLSKSSDDRIDKLKKLAKKIREGDGLDDKQIKELKDELDALVESLMLSESDLTDEQLTELSAFLDEISQVLIEVEVKIEDLLSDLTNSSEKTQNNVSEKAMNNESQNQILETVENLKENIRNVEQLISDTLNNSADTSRKDEFSDLLAEISSDMESLKENTQTLVENKLELLKEMTKTADSNTEIDKTQISEELKTESEKKETTVLQSENSKSNNKLDEGLKDTSVKEVKIDKSLNEETSKSEEVITDKNVEILKFENTLIRSAKVNNPSKAQSFEKNIMKQVVNHTTSNLNILENGSEMILKLYPKNLGEVAVKLAIDKGIVLAEFNVESQTVKEVLESNLSDLRTALSDKGFNLEGLDVSVGDNGSNNSSRQNQQNSNDKKKFFDILDVEEEILNANTSEHSTTIDTLK